MKGIVVAGATFVAGLGIEGYRFMELKANGVDVITLIALFAFGFISLSRVAQNIGRRYH